MTNMALDASGHRHLSRRQMLTDDHPSEPLLNLKKYAEKMHITRQAVHYQLSKGSCAVQPIAGIRPPKWRVADVDAYFAGLTE